MDFLNACGDFGWNADFDVFRQQQRGHAAAVAAGEGDDGHLTIMCSLNGLDDIRGVAAGGNRQQYIARLAECADLLGEDLVVAVVVGDGGDGRAVGGQGDGRQAGALALETVEQLGGEMLGIAGGAAVAAGKNLALVEQGLDHHQAGVLDVWSQNLHGLLLGVNAGLEELADSGLHVHRLNLEFTAVRHRRRS